MNEPREQLLRGGLSPVSLGSRDLERAARNPTCDRLQALTLASLTPALAMAQVYEQGSNDGLSPFAITTGQRFEAFLVQGQARELLKLYRQHHRLGPEARVVDLKALCPGRSEQAITARLEQTLELIKRAARGLEAPELLLFPRLPVELPNDRVRLEPDALVRVGRRYRVVEIKSYPDRAGKTNSAKLRGACRQAAVSTYALSEFERKQGLAPDPEPSCDLIFRKPGRFSPTLRSMSLRAELYSLRRFFEQSHERLTRLTAQLGASSLERAETLNSLAKDYRADCREFCALAKHCRQEACGAEEFSVLGGRVGDELPGLKNIGRALELLHGRGPGPKNAEEEVLQRRLQNAHTQYRKALGYAV